MMNTIALALLLLAPNPGTGIITAPGVYTDGTPRNIATDTNGYTLLNQPPLFGSATSVGSVPNAPRGLITTDLNNDGIPDVVVAGRANLGGTAGIQIFLGNGDGTFSSSFVSVATEQPFMVAAADFNGDGCQDVAFTERATTLVGVMLGNCNGTFQSINTFTVGTTPSWIIAARLGGPSTQFSLVVTNTASNTISVLIGNGSGGFAAHADYSTGAGSSPIGLALADLNDDGFLDAVVATSGITTTFGVLLGATANTFGSVTTFSSLPINYTSMAPFYIIATDLNGDQIPDIAFTSNRGFTCTSFAQSRTGTAYSTPLCYYMDLNGASTLGLAVGDINGDGLPDIVAAFADSVSEVGPTNGIQVLFNQGSTGSNGQVAFKYGYNLFTPTVSGPFMPLVVDVNKDGVLDILYTDTIFYLSSTANGLLGEFLGKPRAPITPAAGAVFSTINLTPQQPPPFTPQGPTTLSLSANVPQGVTVSPQSCLRVTCFCTTACTLPPVALTGTSSVIISTLDAGQNPVGWDLIQAGGTAEYSWQGCLSFSDALTNENTIALLSDHATTCKVSVLNSR